MCLSAHSSCSFPASPTVGHPVLTVAASYYSLILANCFRFMKFLFTWYFLLLFLGLPKKVSISLLRCQLLSPFNKCPAATAAAETTAPASYFVWALKKYAQINFVLFRLKQNLNLASGERNTSCPHCHCHCHSTIGGCGCGLQQQEKGFNCVWALSYALSLSCPKRQEQDTTGNCCPTTRHGIAIAFALALTLTDPHSPPKNCRLWFSFQLRLVRGGWEEGWRGVSVGRCYECKLKVYKSNKFHLRCFNLFHSFLYFSFPLSALAIFHFKIVANCWAFSQRIFNAKCTISKSTLSPLLPPNHSISQKQNAFLWKLHFDLFAEHLMHFGAKAIAEIAN